MTFEKHFHLHLPARPEHLLQPEQVFAGRPPFGELERQEDLLWGYLLADIPLLGEIQFPFQSRISSTGSVAARLQALPLEPAPPFWAELGGTGSVTEGGIGYELELRIHADLPEGEKWGGKALRRMAEVAFERVVGRTLEQLAQGSS